MALSLDTNCLRALYKTETHVIIWQSTPGGDRSLNQFALVPKDMRPEVAQHIATNWDPADNGTEDTLADVLVLPLGSVTLPPALPQHSLIALLGGKELLSEGAVRLGDDGFPLNAADAANFKPQHRPH